MENRKQVFIYKTLMKAMEKSLSSERVNQTKICSFLSKAIEKGYDINFNPQIERHPYERKSILQASSDWFNDTVFNFLLENGIDINERIIYELNQSVYNFAPTITDQVIFSGNFSGAKKLIDKGAKFDVDYTIAKCLKKINYYTAINSFATAKTSSDYYVKLQDNHTDFVSYLLEKFHYTADSKITPKAQLESISLIDYMSKECTSMNPSDVGIKSETKQPTRTDKSLSVNIDKSL